MAVGADFILKALIKEGLSHLFLVPGGLVDPFLEALQQNTELTPIVAAQEGGAAYMADGFARASGGIGTVLGIGGPGLLNMTTAIATAKTDCSPVLALSGEVAVPLEGLGAFQDASPATLDDTTVMKPLTRLSTTVAAAAALNHVLRHAITAMWAQPRGPAHLSLTSDTITGDCSADYVPIRDYLVGAEPLSGAAAGSALATVCRPGQPRIALLVGEGTAGAAAPLKAIAERWSLPVATTLRAKGVFPEDHPLSLGVFGYAGTRHATAALLDEPPDLLVVLGSGLNERDSMHWTLQSRTAGKTTIVQVNSSLDELTGHGDARHSVLGSSAAFIELMQARAAGLDGALNAGAEHRRAWLTAIKKGPRLYDVENCDRRTSPIHPATAIAALRKVYPRDGIVLVDSGAHRAFAGHYWNSFEPNTYISATNLGPMGWAVAAAAGVQCARPDRRVAVITGDGCMQMCGMEVQTAARYRLPVVYLVLNNGALGNVWLRQHKFGALPAELTSIRDHDWAGFARSLGAEGFTVSDPAQLEATYERALGLNSTVVIDVKADKNCPTPVYDFDAGVEAWSFHE